MTHLNFTLIWSLGLLSLLCYQHVDRYGYGGYFGDALETIHGQWLEGPADRQRLFDAAVHGMTAQLNDEHTHFISRNFRQSYESELDQHFSGIGVQMEHDREKGRIVVANTILGPVHPAHDAGMRRGDQILAVGGQPVTGKPLDEAMKLIKGPAGVPVTVTVLHEGEKTPTELTIVRHDIPVDAVLGDVREDDGQWRFLLDTKPPIAYVRVKSFGKGTSDQLRSVLTKLRDEGKLQALIIDVRDDPGGFLDEAVKVCDLFIPEGVIVSTRGRKDDLTGKQEMEAEKASGQAPFVNIPMVVLINAESASASEIFAACMQDHHRAVVIGSRSFGKGSVQKMFFMETGQSILKLTTASYWRPSEKNIHRGNKAESDKDWGVHPDEGYDVPLSKEAEKKRREAQQDRDAYRPGAAAAPAPARDPQLAKAVEYLLSRLHAAGHAGQPAAPASQSTR